LNRLDLKNATGRFEDAKRKVLVSADALKPLLDLVLSYQADSDGRSEVFDFADGDKAYGLGLDLELPLDIRFERNAYRQSLINLAKAHRDVVDLREGIKQEVRRLLRSLKEIEETYAIEEYKLRLAENQVDREQVLYEAGLVVIRDVREAQDELVSAQNNVTRELINHFNTTLDLYLALESIRIGDDGVWIEES